MQTLQQTYRGLSLMVALNTDRLLFVAAIVLALGAGAYIAGL